MVQQPAPAAHRPDGAPYDARDLRLSRIPRRRGVDELRREQCRRRSPGWHLCWPHPQGRQAGRPAGPAGGESRADHQSDHRQGPRHYAAADAARPRRRGDRMRRRAFITLLSGAAAAWPITARAQQPAMPVVAFVSGQSSDAPARQVAAFRKGLSETGYVDGQNVTIEYHWLDGQYDRLPQLMSDLVRRHVAVIASPISHPATLAAKAATATIPIVFGVGIDPVELGLVASLARPGGNATGINFFVSEVVAKRLGLLHDLVPKAIRIAVLVNPANVSSTETTLREIPEAARSLGLQIQVLNASTSREIEEAFATLVHDRAGALFVGPDSFFQSRRVQFATLTARHAIPAAYAVRDYVEA